MSAASTSLASADEGVKRAKARKGTTSCRECKKKKTRCVFSSPEDSVCVSCRRRGITCQSQEFGDDATPDNGEFNMRGRIIRVEAMVETILGKMAAESYERRSNPAAARGDTTTSYSQRALDHGKNTIDGDNFERSNDAARRKTEDYNAFQKAHDGRLNEMQDKYMKIRQTLHEALPSQRVADILIGDARASTYLRVLCRPHSAAFQMEEELPLSLPVLPDVTSHPVLLARKLLQLAICFQQFETSFDDSILDLTEPHKDVMTHYVELASDLVTTNDELVGSLEGMECLVLEGAYHINAGNLRRAWLCARRAMSIAQLMGLQRKSPRQLNILDPTSQTSCSVIWFHIVYVERYLSLLLGAPSSVTDNMFATEENMTGATSTNKLDRIHAVISGLIIDRNETQSYDDLATSQTIDLHLQKASRSVSPEWWLTPEFHQRMDAPGVIASTLRAQTQVIHYSLLNMLHLPHMLRSASEPRYAYSKTACVHASREILHRFISFRTFIRVAHCCRLVDFCAFMAALALLLAHISSDKNPGDDLTSQSLNDRQLIEKAMESMDELNRVNGDELSKQTAEVTRILLRMELESSTMATGAYNVTRVDSEANSENEDHRLRLNIPYFGTVSISRNGPVLPQTRSYIKTAAFQGSSGLDTEVNPSTNLSNIVGSFSPGFYISQVNQGSRSSPAQCSTNDTHHTLAQPFTGFLGNFQDQDLPLPDLFAETDNWAFQGVDTTFFNTFLSSENANQVAGDAWSRWDTLS